jgi:CRISPR system Cascade subunit CasA
MKFNLLDEPWIPFAAPGQRRPRLGSLRSVLSDAHLITDLAVQSPLVTAGLYRLLLATLYRALQGPHNHTEWQRWWQAGLFDMRRLDRYFREVTDRFDLFDPVFPFYQTGNLPEGYRPKPALTLGHQHTAFGANAQMFGGGMNTDSAISAAHAALLLVAFQSYALGGTLAHLPGENPSAKAGTLVKATLVVVKGQSLFHTLMLNLLPFPYFEDDRPAWERGGASTGERVCDGIVDLYTRQARRVCLVRPAPGSQMVSQVQIARGWDPPLYSEQRLMDQMLAWRRKGNAKEGDENWYPVTLGSEQTAWRDLPAFLVETKDAQPAANLLWYERLATSSSMQADLAASGATVDIYGMTSKEFKILSWYRRRITLPTGCVYRAEVREQMGAAVAVAEAVARALRYRLSALQGDIAPDLSDFWAALEGPFQLWLEGSADPSQWRSILASQAWRTYTWHVAALSSSMLTLAQAERQWGRALNAALTTKEKDQ